LKGGGRYKRLAEEGEETGKGKPGLPEKEAERNGKMIREKEPVVFTLGGMGQGEKGGVFKPKDVAKIEIFGVKEGVIAKTTQENWRIGKESGKEVGEKNVKNRIKTGTPEVKRGGKRRVRLFFGKRA